VVKDQIIPATRKTKNRDPGMNSLKASGDGSIVIKHMQPEILGFMSLWLTLYHLALLSAVE
jgi:hypothetical protein